MVLNAPWDRRLGGPRVHIELAEIFTTMGHQVDSFSLYDAYPRAPVMPRLAGITRNFPRHAARWIRNHGRRYDIIDARAGALAATKAQLGFEGLLVARSTGLREIYEREFLAADRATPGGGPRRLTVLPRTMKQRLVERQYRLALARCDLLNVLNSDEERYAREELGMGERTVKFLHGLTRERYAAFSAARRPPRERLGRPVVGFVGAWGRRKGSGDAVEIVAAVRARVPAARFRFLGTGAAADQVIADCGGEAEGIEVVPSFESDELPALLGDVAVGILPSYVEGFPFSVIELLAAGAPVVAYDAPGARETLPRLDRSLLVPRGDGKALGDRVADLLQDPEELERLSHGAIAVADSLRWEDIAAETIRVYRERLSRL